MPDNLQPCLTGHEINEAIETAVASSTDAAGKPATLATVYLRHIRKVRRGVYSWAPHQPPGTSFGVHAHATHP